MKTINVKHWNDRPDNFTGIAIGEDDSRHWYLNGERHREDGPAVEWTSGNKAWYLNNIYYTEAQYKKEMALRSSSLGRLILKDGYFKLEETK